MKFLELSVKLLLEVFSFYTLSIFVICTWQALKTSKFISMNCLNTVINSSAFKNTFLLENSFIIKIVVECQAWETKNATRRAKEFLTKFTFGYVTTSSSTDAVFGVVSVVAYNTLSILVFSYTVFDFSKAALT